MIEKGIKIDKIVCVDTTKEFPEMYSHIEKVKEFIKPLEIEVVKIDFDYWFGEHVKVKGKRVGAVGYGWPDFRNRWCTSLKQDAYGRVAGSLPYNPRKRGGLNKIPIGTVEFHGIAFDERERAEKNKDKYLRRTIRYPLIEWGVTEAQALDYCYSKGLDWGGLYKKFKRVSCWCCPLSRMGELKVLHKDYPELWEKLELMEEKSSRKFKGSYTVKGLGEKFSAI
jgi:3'-phosphoadenosine 5'-phosphosulfate sulfotransferase (PAPS reductase)/FAD synthetase